MAQFHTTFDTGAKIRIVLKNGDVVIARFKEKRGHKWLRTDKGDVAIKDIKSAGYYKPMKHEI